VAFGHELAHHDFTIYQVFGTTQTYKTDFQAYIRTKWADFIKIVLLGRC
jgi:hypothetical protein